MDIVTPVIIALAIGAGAVLMGWLIAIGIWALFAWIFVRRM